MKIVLIDNERILNESLSDLIEALGHEVKGYFSIKDALQQEDFATLDMVICDLGLPEECAYNFVQWVKLNHEHLPFVILSAFSEEEKVTKALEAGADLYLLKPLKLGQLQEAFTLYSG